MEKLLRCKDLNIPNKMPRRSVRSRKLKCLDVAEEKKGSSGKRRRLSQIHNINLLQENQLTQQEK